MSENTDQPLGSLNTKQQQVEKSFSYHKPKGDQTDRYEVLTSEFKKLAHLIVALTPESHEQDTALTLLHLSRMSSNAAIAVNE
jgi:hypothetical protein